MESLKKKIGDNVMDIINNIKNAKGSDIDLKDAELIELLQEKYNNNSAEKELEAGEKVKYYYTARCKRFHYFVSNYGKVYLAVIDDLTEENKTKEYDRTNFSFEKYYIPQDYNTLCLNIDWCINQYQDTNIFHEYKFNSSTPIYQMVGEVWLKNEYDVIKEIRYDESERMELHHIDGNNYNCRADNLIYLPNRIHAKVHKKI